MRLSLKNALSRFLPPLARFLPVIGVVSLALAALSALWVWNGTRSELRAQATVTENTATQLPDGSILYTTHLRFRLPNGGLMEFTDPSTSTDPDDPDFDTGKVVPVLYPPSHPESARVATIARLYPMAITLAILGIVLFDVGTILRLRAKRLASRNTVNPQPLP